MPVNFPDQGKIFRINGVRLGTAGVNIRGADPAPDRDDVTVISIDAGACSSALFTRNAFRAAPVILAHQRSRISTPRAALINSGNANAATGERGLEDARASCGHLAGLLHVDEEEVLPFSTGVIGERLPLDMLMKGIDMAVADLSPDHWLAAARAIMTTDTRAKCVSRKIVIAGHPVVLTGMAKGAGMMRPDLATMLAFIATDAVIEQAALDGLLKSAADSSFNRITVDGDTSTNDSLMLIATARSTAAVISSSEDAGYQPFLTALSAVATQLAQMVIRDAEGATKFVTVEVSGGATADECLKVAYTLAESPLVKTAIFAGDPNWGRFCMAIGRAGLRSFDTATLDLFLDQVCVIRRGLPCDTYREEQGAAVMQKPEFSVRIDLGRGPYVETLWTSDLSHEYVRINAEYRT